jgi:capsular exopolysaccharide synthesis family protein
MSPDIRKKEPAQDIQLAPSSGNLPMTADPYGPNGQPVTSPLHKVHRLLRGRYNIAITLAIICGVLGATAGALSQTRHYKSIGLIEIRPTMPTPDAKDIVIPMYQAYVQAQATLIQSDRVIQAAIKSPQWTNYHPGVTLDDALVLYGDRLGVDPVRGSSLIQVAYTDEKPDTAKNAVAAVIDAYMTIYGNNASKALQDKLAYWTTRKTALQNQINNAKATIATLSQDSGENLDLLLNAKIPEKVKLDAMVQETEMALNAAKAAMPTTNVAPRTDGPISDDTMRSIAAADPTFRQHLAEKRRADFDVGRLLKIYGPKHRIALDAIANRDAIDAEVQKEARSFLTSNAGVRFNLNGEAAAVTPAELAQLQKRYDNLKAIQEQERLEIQAIAKQRSDIHEQQDKIEQAQAGMDEANRTYESLYAQQQLANQVNVLNDGNTPTSPSEDKRKKFAVAGFLGGALFPLGLMILYGMFDDRYRYSDEAGSELSGITLLGILPNLPDRLGDPEQATTAAHCVHQIRTMLQIGQPAGEPQAIAVTSATSGDGKTSLTLALGLSYAACGTRVLLIDCDLVGAGLTHRMDIDSEEGILEAIANRGLLEYMRTTDINDIAIIPVGSNQNHHASTLSPQSLRRMIVEAKEHFDVILIDTGPILGSIEASLVCTAVDGVVLAVARGQQRPMVEKSLNHLVGIGARLLGVVFNRAQGADFTNSISGMSARNQRNGKGGPFGPVARAVASSYKPSNNGEN